MAKKQLTAEEQAEKFWDEVDYLAQEKIYKLLTSNLPLPGLKLITDSYNYSDKHQELTGLFLHRDLDYRALLGDIENQYQENLPSKESLAGEIALNYIYLLIKGLIAEVSEYDCYDSSFFANLTSD